MDFCNAIFSCITSQPDKAENNNARTAQQLANDVVNTLYKAEKNGLDLKHDLRNIVHDYGWTENIAAAVLNSLEMALKAGAPMGQAMKEAFEKTVKEASDFAHEHPVYCTLIALGILAILAPWVISALGFGASGPVEGSFAALWQARYVGYVPKGSLFSFFQRLGMTLK